MRPFYVTTPIYYVNGEPHIGHAYSTIAADVVHRFHKVRGRRSHFLTGTDEHGQKIERKAVENKLAPKEFVDRLIPAFREAWEALGCEYDDFIRTTDARHQEFVRALWKRCEDAGDIYLGEYEGWYSIIDEAFFTDKDVVDGKAPTGNPVERVKEKGYFFRLSKYADRLLELYEKHPQFVRPEGRFNEVKSFVRGGLEDLSISRTTFRWGIPVPSHPDHVVYVWFDALANYISALGGPGAELYERHWEPNGEVIHLVGKEITRFHCVFWPAFLMSAGLPLPTGIFAHGWMTVNGEKMSKSAGNFLPPTPIADAVGADTLRYYLMRDISLGADSDFSHQNLIARYHGELGNGLGNLLNRIVASILKQNFDGVVPAVSLGDLTDVERTLIATAERVAETSAGYFAGFQPHRAIESIWELVTATNKYVDQMEPWALAKRGEKARLGVVCYTVLEALRFLSIMLWPVMPSKCDELRAQLGLTPLLPTTELDRWPSVWGGLAAGTKTDARAPLFPRFDDDQQRAIYGRLGVPLPDALRDTAKAKTETKSKAEKAPAAAKKSETKVTEAKTETPPGDGLITIDDLTKVDLRLGLVLSGERVPKSDKLLELKVDIGEPEPRNILAGIGKTYAPEDLVGRRIVVVANLAPRPMMGRISHGMVMAVSDENALSVLSPDKEIKAGVRAK